MVAPTLTATRFISSTTGTRGMPLVQFTHYFFQLCHLNYLLIYLVVLIENVTVVILFDNSISIFFQT